MEAKIDVMREIAALKLLIVRQQKIVGDLERRAQRSQARGARVKLHQMLNQMDALESHRPKRCRRRCPLAPIVSIR
jgi:hypothetical protein